MGNFVSSLLARHIDSGEKVLPRLSGIYEHAKTFRDTGFTELTDSYSPVVLNEPEPGFPATAKALGRASGHEFPVGEQTRMPPEPVNKAPETVQEPGFQHLPLNNAPRQDSGNFSQSPKEGYLQPEIQIQHHPGFEKEMQPAMPNPLEKKSDTLIEIVRAERVKERVIDLEFTVRPKEVTEKPVFPGENLNTVKRPTEKASGILGEPPGLRPGFSDSKQAMPLLKEEPKQAPVIKVSIGQIHIRAVAPPPPVNNTKPKDVYKPILTLEDYLKGRG